MRLAVLVLLAAACSVRPSEVPGRPAVSVGTATLSGRVLDLSDIPIAGIAVTCAESDARRVTADDGRWTLEVPADTSLTLRAVPVDPLSVYKPTTLAPMQLSNRAVVAGVDLLVIPGSTIGGLNGIASGDENMGVISVRVVSLSGKCTPEDGVVEVEQTPTARAVYNLPGTSQPDRNLLKMQPDTRPQAWLSGVAPGTYYSVKFTKPGCTQLPFPVAYQGVRWLEGLRIQTKALAQLTVFTE